MGRSISVRLATVGLVATSLTIIPLAAPAPAVVAKPACKKLVSPPPKKVGKNLVSKSTISLCTPLSATGGKGTSTTTIPPSGPVKSKTVWANNKGTTLATVTYKSAPTKGKCPAASVARVLSTGKVTGGSGAALKAIPKGTKVTASVCVAKNNSATLEPGTKYVF
jgi:hypothetical protein